MSQREEQLPLLPPLPADRAGEDRLRRLGLFGLVNGGIFLLGLVGLASLGLSFPPALAPLRVTVVSLLAASAGAGVWLGRRFWTALGEELRRRKQAAEDARAADRAKGSSCPM